MGSVEVPDGGGRGVASRWRNHHTDGRLMEVTGKVDGPLIGLSSEKLGHMESQHIIEILEKD